ncbi:tripartite tricarboxylate transporter substrate binding protein [Variovorax paradoxus]|nr:tripartite tricarboxylate transporter substrate binding protein [Variovorax paradoxus]
MLHRREWLMGMAALSLQSAPGLATAQSGYPSKPINMICGFAAGSATDIVARVVGQKLSERLGQPVVVQNVTGAASTIAADNVARAAPDGYTLMTVSSAITIAPGVYRNLKLDVEKDLVAIASIGVLPTVLMVTDSLPVHTFGEFVDYAKKNPGKLNYGSSGPGGSTHMAAALLSQTLGITMTHVPYRGNSPAGQALMAGEVQVLVDTTVLAAQSVKTGRVRALAVTGAERSPALPDVPTFREAGLADFDASVMFGIMGPKGLPPAIVERINREMGEVLKDPGVQTQLVKTGGLHLTAGTPEQFARLVSDDIAKWKKVAGSMGIRAE